MANTVYKHVTGMDSLSAVLQALPKDMRSKILVRATKAAAVPVVTLAKGHARRSQRTGALVESLTSVAKSYPATGTAVAVIGPDKDYFKHGSRIGKDGDNRGADKPSKYAHLVEFGHHVGRRGEGKGTKGEKEFVGPLRFVPAKPFMRPAITQSQAAVQTILAVEIGAGIEDTRRRMVKQGAHKS